MLGTHLKMFGEMWY